MSDKIDLEIRDLGAHGDGIGRDSSGEAVFVSGALPGEKVRVGALQAAGVAGRRATLDAVLTPAPGRAIPACAHFGTCGGCAAQHMGDGIYENWKREIVADALAREGVAANVGPLHRVPGASRRRARLFAARTQAGVVIGFHSQGSHMIVGMDQCPALAPQLFAFVAPLKAFLVDRLAPGARAEVEVQLVDGVLDVVLRLAAPLNRNLYERLARFAEDAGIARISWQSLTRGRRPQRDAPETVVERQPIRANFGGISVALPPLAFLQASDEGERALVAQVTARVPEGARVADLYAGAGTFTFPLAKTRRVAAFDGASDLIAALNRAARGSGLGERVTATARDLERRPLSASELKNFDAVLFDPPRGGAPVQAKEIAASKVPLAVAVSCNPTSFARDARILIEGGFEIGPVMPVDQFVWTRHVELAAAFQR
ncbi:MAG: 23S rRNA (uracil1939-C5)-methyltransferase [Alphaproteobacteria bacterium]